MTEFLAEFACVAVLMVMFVLCQICMDEKKWHRECAEFWRESSKRLWDIIQIKDGANKPVKKKAK